MPTDAAPGDRGRPRRGDAGGRRLATPEIVLLALLIGELVWFSLAGTNFLTLDNGLEILRASTEVGLLALALTPVILTGGIDLSCGALLGLSAVVFGAIWRDAGQPLPVAVAAALGVGLARRRDQRVDGRRLRPAGADRDARHRLALPRPRRRAHRRRGQLLGLPRRRSSISARAASSACRRRPGCSSPRSR